MYLLLNFKIQILENNLLISWQYDTNELIIKNLIQEGTDGNPVEITNFNNQEWIEISNRLKDFIIEMS